MSRQSISVLFTLVAAALIMSAAEAAAPKIGYVNTERILREAGPAKIAQKKLETEFKSRDNELQAMTKKLKTMGEALERDRSILSDSERRRRQRGFTDLEKDFQRKQRQFREDLNQRRNEELALVLERANRAIRQIASKQKYDLILQEAVYAAPRINITNSVIKALGK